MDLATGLVVGTSEKGGFRYLKSPNRPFSLGVASENGYGLERVAFAEPLSLERGLNVACTLVESRGRPRQAIAAFELRIPSPMSEDTFVDFNRAYLAQLTLLDLASDHEQPLARTNVVSADVTKPSLHAFTYTIPADGLRPQPFVLSGITESVSNGSVADKIISISENLKRRLAALSAELQTISSLRLYCRESNLAAAVSRITTLIPVGRRVGVTWCDLLPPIDTRDFEIDVRCVATERSLQHEPELLVR